MNIKFIDPYALKARFYPTMIVITPLCLIVLSIASGKLDLLNSLAIAIGSGFGFSLVMDQIGRDGGRNKELHLFCQWEGVPTTQLLRHRDTTIDAITKKRYHQQLSVLIPNLKIPSEQEEINEPSQADQIYLSCTEYLKSATRDYAKYPLVFQENSNYGFRRNLWGMRPAGLLFSLIGSIVCCFILRKAIYQNTDILIPAISTLLSTVLLLLWTFRFTPSWVRIIAYAYARQLIACCDSIASSTHS